MSKQRARHLESSRAIARLIAGADHPEWLGTLIMERAEGFAFRRGVDSLTPVRTALRTRLKKLRAAANLILEEMHSPGVRDFLGWSADPGSISDEDFGWALLKLVKRIDRAATDETIVNTDGDLKKGSGPARAAWRLPPEIATAILVAEMWRYFHKEDPPPGGKIAAQAAQTFWQLIGGDALAGGSAPFVRWKSRFNRALKGEVDGRRQKAFDDLRVEISRELKLRGGAPTNDKRA